MKKKLLSFLLAVSLVSIITGCGSSTDSAVGTADTTDAGNDKVQINIYRSCFNIARPNSDQVKKVEDAINDYIANKINVEVHITDISSGEYADKTNLALVNKEINLLWTASWQGTVGTNDLYKSNAVYDISDLLPGTTLYNSMQDSIWEASKYDGKDYFIPVYKESYEGYDLKFPETYATEFGIDTSSIKELKDLEAYLEWCKTEKGLKYPYMAQTTGMFFRYYIDKWDFFDGGNSLYGIDRESNTVVDPTQSQEYLDFCTMMCEWSEKGYISEEEVTKTASTDMKNSDWGLHGGVVFLEMSPMRKVVMHKKKYS